MTEKQTGFGLILLIIAVGIVALLAVWQLTGTPGKVSKQTREGLIETQEKAKAEIGTINDQLKQQYPTDIITP